MDTLIQDVRYALRGLLRRRGFAAGATLTLALGIGANTTLFSVVEGLLLSPPVGIGEPEGVAAIYTSDFSGEPYRTSSYPDWRDLRAEGVFEDIAAYDIAAVGVGEGAETRVVNALAVSANWFEVLRVRPFLGRVFLPDEEETADDIVVLSHAFWRRELGGRSDVVGTAVRINGRNFGVVGVAPEGMIGFDRTLPGEVFIPTVAAQRLDVGLAGRDERDSRSILMVGRLRAGSTMAGAQQAMTAIAERLRSAYPVAWTDVSGQTRRLSVVAEADMRVPPDGRGLVMGLTGVLAATAGIVLLICCANVAGLLLARSAGRTREMGIRVSIGAGRGRLVRQLLTESVVLALAGAAVGTLAAFWATEFVRSVLSSYSPIVFSVGIDVRVLAFTLVIAVATGLLFGLAPALGAARVDLIAALKSDAADFGARRGRVKLRDVLVGSQIALSLLLVVGALLLVRTLRSAYRIDPGFAVEDALLVSIRPVPGVPQDRDGAMVAEELRARIGALPSVRSISWGAVAPLAGFGPRRGMQVVGYSPADGEDMEFHVDHVGPSFFETTEIAIERGRPIDATDRAGAAPVVVVNRAFAERFWPGRDALGERISMSDREWTVVGVAENVHFITLTGAVRPFVWIPALQMRNAPLFHIRATGNTDALAAEIARIVESVAPGWTMRSVSTVESRLAGALFRQRAAGALVTGFALLALVLAAVGLYGVVAHAVACRTREVGIRAALGAPARSVLALFFRQAMSVILCGTLAGLAVASITTRALSGLLIGVGARDPATFVVAPLILLAATGLAVLIPASRALRADPLTALRAE